MKKVLRNLFLALLCFVALIVTLIYLKDTAIAVLEPRGWIGMKEGRLLITATLLMLLVVIPVFVLTFVFAWRYREGNKKAKYTPEWADSPLAECIWWGLPCAIIAVLSVLTWQSCHELDPYRPIENGKKPLTVQVIALQWKWLFLYPEYQVASLNWLQIPEQTPIRFEITAQAPMNSFWIPDLGGQIFAMPGMSTELHLIADGPGDFRGCSANISGRGFSGMTFTTRACSQELFEEWITTSKHSLEELTQERYDQLAKPSEYDPVVFFSWKEPDLFQRILMKYMGPMEMGDTKEEMKMAPVVTPMNPS